MTPGEVWWLVEAKTPDKVKNRTSEMREVVAMFKAAKAKEAATNG